MDPIMRVVLPLIGAVFGAGIGDHSAGLFHALVGAAIGFIIADLVQLRSTLHGLSQELKELQRRVKKVASSPTSNPFPPSIPIPTPIPDVISEPALSETVISDEELTAQALAAEENRPQAAPVAARAVTGGERPLDFDDIPGIAPLRRFFTGGNAVVRAGVIVVFFGVAFLLRYMAEHSHVPIEVRLSGVVLAGIALLAFGWRLRRERPGYALALQGAAIGVLYLTIFAAFRLFHLLPPTIAFVALLVVASLSAVLALLQNSQSFALLGVTGGFLAPVLASNGEGSHVALFSYYAVLNAGIVGMAWFKTWRPLNVAGFVFTFGIGTLWGVLQYRPELFGSTEPFLVLFFAMYFVVAILLSVRQPPDLRGYVDATLVFGTPLVAFGLQSLLLRGRSMDLAFSALGLSALYLISAALLRRRRDRALELLTEACIALGVLFLTVAIPLALEQRWSAVGWAFEGTALVWIGIRQNRVLARACGALLNIAASYFVAREFDLMPERFFWLEPVGFFAIATVSGAIFTSACLLSVGREKLRQFETALPAVLCLYGMLWWLAEGIAELLRYLPHHFTVASLLFFSFSAVLSSEICRRAALSTARFVALLLLPLLILYCAAAALDHTHPFARGGWVSWPIVLVAWYWIMRRHEGAADHALSQLLQTLSMWLVCVIAGWECGWALDVWVKGSVDWPLAAMVLPSLAMLLALPRLVTRIEWPFVQHRDVLMSVMGAGIAVALGLWSVATDIFVSGDTAPLPYLPILNPVDLAQIGILLGLLRYARFVRGDPRLPLPAVMGLAFAWLNALLLRTLHHWGGVPYQVDAMFASTLIQTSVSIFWAVVALGGMVDAGRRRSRPLWIAGATLMAVVIAKLFLVDLSRVGSIERIVSFLGVGGLMLIVGYVSPLPPVESESKS